MLKILASSLYFIVYNTPLRFVYYFSNDRSFNSVVWKAILWTYQHCFETRWYLVLSRSVLVYPLQLITAISTQLTLVKEVTCKYCMLISDVIEIGMVCPVVTIFYRWLFVYGSSIHGGVHWNFKISFSSCGIFFYYCFNLCLWTGRISAGWKR